MNSNIYQLNSGTDVTLTNSDSGIGNCYINPYTLISPITYTPYIYPTPQSYDLQLRKVENGWILLKGGKEYILKSPDEIIKYMKDEKTK